MTPHDLKVSSITEELERQLKSQIYGKEKFFADVLVAKRHGIEAVIDEVVKNMHNEGWKIKAIEKKKNFIVEVFGEIKEDHKLE